MSLTGCSPALAVSIFQIGRRNDVSGECPVVDVTTMPAAHAQLKRGRKEGSKDRQSLKRFFVVEVGQKGWLAA